MTSPLFEPMSGALTVQYEPNEKTPLLENPPRFTWMAAKLDRDRYVLQVSTSPDFSEGEATYTADSLPYNFYTPDRALEPGSYWWRYALLEDSGDRSEWSQVRSFIVPADLPETPLPSRNGRFAHTSAAHPRLWLQADRLEAFRGKVLEDNTYCGWDLFYEKSVLPWTVRPLIAEPLPYPDHKRVPKLWRQMYMDCQEALYAVKHLSVAAIVLQDEALLAKAKEWLLHVASWDTEGPTARDYNDEAAFRVAGALAWGYDWLYDSLTGDELEFVRSRLLRRTEQVAFHVIERSKIHHVPYDSHAVRSLSSVLVPCCIALLGEEAAATDWLDYTLEYYSALYTPWGGIDGGWAEGPMYWTTGMAFVTEALSLIKPFCGIDLLARPFFTKTGDFPLYCYPPGTVRSSFGDMSNLGEPPILKTGFNIRHFAGLTGNGWYQWYFEQVKKTDVDPDSKFYNYGWWDFRFDDVAFRHDNPHVEAVPPTDIEPLKWFRDVGWVAMHDHMESPDDHIMLLAKASKYGSISHSHGDQGSFLLHAYGEPLATHSGHYLAFGTSMHLDWRRQTRSKNSILIDGLGQYAGNNKALSMEAIGIVEAVEKRPDCRYVRMNATPAYREHVPYLERYLREIYYFGSSYFVIVDYVDLSQAGTIDWLLHTMKPIAHVEGNHAIYEGKKAKLDIRFVYNSSGSVELSAFTGFDGVNAAELAGLEMHSHLRARTAPARRHRIAALLVPMRASESRYVPYFMDDQDHGVHLYFTDGGVTSKVEVLKAY
ncbi:DUF4962 domain-containing protein [Paenibacillus koleovorans]|uniref:DUF4962 domain-containing protein n=1 Tax=Paenibacillus koleovorans TaxID=121608 RepID=UPI000FD77C79|nr:DUF4962 domain-containing protein [Paenibacillus koleovorans]